MASDKHLAKLKEGAEAWNSWRRAEPAVRPDLQGLSLTLAQKQWGETNGGPIDLSHAMMREANLRHATLIRSNLSAAALSGANLSGARLQKADLRHANLSNVRFDDADLTDTLLDGADLSGADLRSARNLSAKQIEAARGDTKTLLPLQLPAPRTWANGSELVRLARDRECGNPRACAQGAMDRHIRPVSDPGPALPPRAQSQRRRPGRRVSLPRSQLWLRLTPRLRRARRSAQPSPGLPRPRPEPRPSRSRRGGIVRSPAPRFRCFMSMRRSKPPASRSRRGSARQRPACGRMPAIAPPLPHKPSRPVWVPRRTGWLRSTLCQRLRASSRPGGKKPAPGTIPTNRSLPESDV